MYFKVYLRPRFWHTLRDHVQIPLSILSELINFCSPWKVELKLINSLKFVQYLKRISEKIPKTQSNSRDTYNLPHRFYLYSFHQIHIYSNVLHEISLSFTIFFSQEFNLADLQSKHLLVSDMELSLYFSSFMSYTFIHKMHIWKRDWYYWAGAQ